MYATKALNTVEKTDDEGGNEKQVITDGGRRHRENQVEEQTGKELEKPAGWYGSEKQSLSSGHLSRSLNPDKGPAPPSSQGGCQVHKQSGLCWEQETPQLSSLRGRCKTSESFKQSPSPEEVLGLCLPNKAQGGDTEVPAPRLMHTVQSLPGRLSRWQAGRAHLLAPWQMAPAQMCSVSVAEVQGSRGC